MKRQNKKNEEHAVKLMRRIIEVWTSKSIYFIVLRWRNNKHHHHLVFGHPNNVQSIVAPNTRQVQALKKVIHLLHHRHLHASLPPACIITLIIDDIATS